MIIKRIAFFLLGAGLVLFVPTALAQSGNFQIIIGSINNGGWTSNDSRFTLLGTTGQFNATNAATDGHFTVAGGLWTGSVGPKKTTVHLPLVVRAEPPTPPPAGWQRISQANLLVTSLAIQGDQLFASTREDTSHIGSGGLYRRSLTACTTPQNLIRIDGVNAHTLFSVVFQGVYGLAAAYSDHVFFSENSGNSWRQVGGNIGDTRAVALAGTSTFYAGSHGNGIFTSTDRGNSWTPPQSPIPRDISILTLSSTTLWIGTDQEGIWELATGTSPADRTGNLPLGNSRKVWDFVFDNSNIYIATYNGVFKGDGSGQWQPFDLQGKQLLSLLLRNGQLYAGARPPDNQQSGGGVWRRSLTGGGWEPITPSSWDSFYVRDLVYDENNCHGLLAATTDGVWLYH